MLGLCAGDADLHACEQQRGAAAACAAAAAPHLLAGAAPRRPELKHAHAWRVVWVGVVSSLQRWRGAARARAPEAARCAALAAGGGAPGGGTGPGGPLTAVSPLRGQTLPSDILRPPGQSSKPLFSGAQIGEDASTVGRVAEIDPDV